MHKHVPHQSRTLSARDILDQLERISNSRPFHRSDTLQKFLRFIVTKTLNGQEAELKEYTIGFEAFGRGSGFDPKTDAIVRVQANVLRKKLRNYYETEGVYDKVLIEIPRGHYVPRFSYHQPPVPAAGDDGIPRPNFSWRLFSRPALTFLLGVLAAGLFQTWLGEERHADQMSVRANSEKENLPGGVLWDNFIHSESPTLLTYGAPQFFSFDGHDLYVRDTFVNTPGDVSLSASLRSLGSTLQVHPVPVTFYTGVGEATGIHLISRFFYKRSRDVQVTQSRFVSTSDLKRANLIFVSSARFHTLAKELPFPTSFAFSAERAGFVNLRPRPGEKQVYSLNRDEGYALITLWPGAVPERRILVLTGLHTWGTQASAEYVSTPEYLTQLDQHLSLCAARQGLLTHPSFFQILIRVEAKDDEPIAIHYVTHHDLEVTKEAEVNIPGEIAWKH